MKDIDADKIVEQRKRYKTKEQEYVRKVISGEVFRENSMELSMMRMMAGVDEPIKVEIKEADAGLIVIRERKKKERDKAAEKYKQEKVEVIKEVELYNKLGRNDKCSCGSGAKFKKCCKDRIDKLKLRYRL